MKVTAILCNHAEAQNNLLYINGAGIDRSFVPPGAPAPYGVTLALAILITVPWTATNEQHKAVIEMVDADGHPVTVPRAEGEQALKVELEFNVGRPPGLTAGDEQSINIAVNFPGVPLPKMGTYRFNVQVDGSVEAEVPYRLVSMQQTVGFGPTALPRF